ncbi:hypothetical protein KY290_029027 [Solanum tuberosum]|uniref:HSF-type DNA-binding domain-containing protein n=1 Tax=Solanum tuberosum TaxID=4113 RepID=A0ABQ7UJL4_SOLTU|nr:hypothetical protein KY290_029027 [Solanum tuberosum]
MEGVHEIGNPLPPFLSKTYDMVDDRSTDTVVSWSKSNNSFVVWNVPEFSRDILPKTSIYLEKEHQGGARTKCLEAQRSAGLVKQT